MAVSHSGELAREEDSQEESAALCCVLDQSEFGSSKQRKPNLPAWAHSWAPRGESVNRDETSPGNCRYSGVQEWHRLRAYVGALLVSGNALFALCCDTWMVFVLRVKVKRRRSDEGQSGVRLTAAVFNSSSSSRALIYVYRLNTVNS